MFLYFENALVSYFVLRYIVLIPGVTSYQYWVGKQSDFESNYLASWFCSLKADNRAVHFSLPTTLKCFSHAQTTWRDGPITYQLSGTCHTSSTPCNLFFCAKQTQLRLEQCASRKDVDIDGLPIQNYKMLLVPSLQTELTQEPKPVVANLVTLCHPSSEL